MLYMTDHSAVQQHPLRRLNARGGCGGDINRLFADVNVGKLNTLLIMPRLAMTVGEGYQFPLGIAYVSACLKKAGYKVFTVNLNHDARPIADIIKEAISKHDIDIVGSGGISIQYNSLFEIFKCVKEIDSKITTIAGGGIITADPEVAMEALENADIGVIGEGEITICELIDAIENRKSLSSVDGLIYRQDEKYSITACREEIRDIDSIPFPDYDGFELDKYLELPPPDVNNLMEKRLVLFIGSRSCPFKCTFCFHTAGIKYRQRSMKSIAAELDYLIEKYHIGFVFMADELFGKPKRRLREFCTYMSKKNLPWRGSFRVTDIDEPTIAMLKAGNCAIIGLGLESADNRILISMKKHITIEQTENALKLIYDAKMPFSGNFIFGDINETVETAQTTLNWWEKHSQYSINLWPIVAYPGSYLYQYACEKNIIKDRIKFLKDGCPTVNVSKLNAAEMSWLATKLLESPFKTARNINNIVVENIDPVSGRVDIRGECDQCGHTNLWKNIRLFISVSLTCSNCSQKHNTPFPPELQRVLAANVGGLLEQYPKIGIWGVTFQSIGLYNDFDVFKSPAIFAIDNSSTKQMIDLYGKKVFSPDVLLEENIPLIISFYPNSTQQLSIQIHGMYPGVKKVIDASELISADSSEIPAKKLPAMSGCGNGDQAGASDGFR
jgi:radical SAM superfamily enzyme YgiQ (UPF0313 family)